MKRALSNTFYLFNDWFVIMVFGYVFWIILAKLLSVEDVGIFSAISNIAIFLTTITVLGYNTSAIRIVSDKISKGEVVGGLNKYFFKTSIFANILMSAAVILFFNFFKINSIGFLESLAIAGYLFLNSLYNVALGILQGMQNMKRVFSTDLLDYILKLALTAAFIFLGAKYFGPVLAYVIATIIALAFRLQAINFSGNGLDKKEVWKYSLPAMIGGFGLILFFQSNVIILGAMGTMAEVGIFTLAFMIATPIRAIYQSVSSAIFPITTAQWVAGEKEKAVELLSRSIRYTLIFALPALVLIFLFSSEILLIFTTEEYLAGANAMRIISIGSLFFGISLLFATILFSAGRPNENRNIQITGGILNTIVCFFAVPFFGINGASLAFVIGSFAAFFLSLYWYKKFIKSKLRHDYILNLAAAAAIFFAFSYSVKFFFGPIPSLIISAFVGIAVYMVALLAMKFFDEYDLRLISSVEEKIPAGKLFFSLAKKLIQAGTSRKSSAPK